MIYLTMLNTLAIAFIFYNIFRDKIMIRRNETFWNNTLMGYIVYVGKVNFYVPIRNSRKTELSEEISRMMLNDKGSVRQALGAKFSWLKTWDEVYQFEKDYGVVDRKIVENLVSNFEPRK